MGMGEMLKKLFFVGVSAACLTLPAAAESYIKGDGCGGTYVDRKSEMMAGNITGGSRYKCTPFPKKAKAVTQTKRSAAPTRSYTQPTTSTYRYQTPSHTYSNGTVTYTSPSHTTYHSAPRHHSGHSYVTTRPHTTYSHSGTTTYSSGSHVTTTPRSHGYTTSTRGHVTTTPSTTYHHGGTTHHRSGTTSYNSGSTHRSVSPSYTTGTTHRSSTTYHAPSKSYSPEPTKSYQSGNVTYDITPPVSAAPPIVETARPIKSVETKPVKPSTDVEESNPFGTPRVEGNLANGFSTETESVSVPEPAKPQAFSFSKPETFIRTNPE